MSDIAIKVENLGKLYHIGAKQERHDTLRDALVARFRRDGKSKENEALWALKDVSFEVKRGEVVGVIGRNGAGKSTLLKILSRITEPSTGRVDIHGRVGSLLEVGTGFHPELTGRENIFLNGAILGMKRTEIDRKFDQIVDFSGVERFLDTPVKRYSSGMYVRLAFAVAAHLDPEILLVDEVLAVGDAEFQKKCLGKMGDVAKEGRTVLFVSHNMAAVENLCRLSIVFQQGQVIYEGFVEDAVRVYMRDVMSKSAEVALTDRKDRHGNGRIRVVNFWLEDEHGDLIRSIRSGQRCSLVFEYQCNKEAPLKNVVASFAILNERGFSLILHRTNFSNQNFSEVPPHGIIHCEIQRVPLVAGRYFIGTYLEVESETADDPGVIADFTVEEGDFFGTGSPGLPSHSPFLIDGHWSVSPY